MRTAKLNIWISELDDPCRISSRTWYVTIYNCDGKLLQWCDRRYVVLRAKCGHLEVEVPPWCYRISAVWSFGTGAGGIFYGNHFTDSTIVHASCGQETCVTLFTPSAHRCGVIFERAIRDLARQKAIKPELAKKAEEVLADVIKTLPSTITEFELGHMEDIERLVEEQEKG